MTDTGYLEVRWEVIPPAPWMNYPDEVAQWVVETSGKWGSENTPCVLFRAPRLIAERVVKLHNDRLTADAEAA